MTWNAWPALLQQQRSLRTLCCDFRFPAHRLEPLALARCKATSAQIRRNCSMAGLRGSARCGEPGRQGLIFILGVKARARENSEAPSDKRSISANKTFRLVCRYARSILAAGSHGHSEP